MKAAKKPETKAAITEAADPAEAVLELLKQGVELVSAIHHQNDHTREWVARAKAILDPDATTKADEEDES